MWTKSDICIPQPRPVPKPKPPSRYRVCTGKLCHWTICKSHSLVCNGNHHPWGETEMWTCHWPSGTNDPQKWDYYFIMLWWCDCRSTRALWELHHAPCTGRHCSPEWNVKLPLGFRAGGREYGIARFQNGASGWQRATNDVCKRFTCMWQQNRNFKRNHPGDCP